jgi:hypothetical protein
MEKIETPELDKIRKIREKSQAIGEFLDWLLGEKGYHIAEYKKFDEFDEEQLVTIYLDREKILGEYFGIDLKKAEEERVKILNSIRQEAK